MPLLNTGMQKMEKEQALLSWLAFLTVCCFKSVMITKTKQVSSDKGILKLTEGLKEPPSEFPALTMAKMAVSTHLQDSQVGNFIFFGFSSISDLYLITLPALRISYAGFLKDVGHSFIRTRFNDDNSFSSSHMKQR